MEPPRPNVQEGGSVGSHEPMAARFTAAQLRRSDPLSAHIMNYAPKTTEQQRQEREARKAAAQALRDNARNQRNEKAAAKEVAKLRKQHEANMKKPIR
jgi:membrane-bound ClpP family serine protease